MIKKDYLEESLHRHFNKSSFLPGQQEIMEDVLNGNDVLGILPTGSGKSLCYQLPAKLLSGTTIVVSPLISLMIDQVKQLKATHFKEVIALNSFMNPMERRNAYQHLNKYKLVYVSPELLQQPELISYLKRMNISLFVIDEAHCISQWGHEFRPDYLKLSEIIEEVGGPPVLALSATATKDVQQDIMKSLKKQHMKKHIYPMDRENIIYCVKEVMDDSEKISTLTELLQKHCVPTIIYFSSRITTEKTAKLLSDKLPSHRIAFYHGGMEQMDRTIVQQQFMNDQLDVICCTSAFGMGINKQNIRLIVHYHFSPQLESFIQETGRAGRGGKSSVSLLLYCKQDVHIPGTFIKKELPSINSLKYVFNKMYQLHTQKRKIPLNESETENFFQLSETQWRFLFFQLEKHGMIKGMEIMYQKDHWEKVFQEIATLIETRTLMKESKLREMIDWMNEKNCLRKQLYQNFQPSYTIPDDHCCSNCGFSFSNWNPVSTNPVHTIYSWQTKLKKILIGDSNEETK